MNGFRGKKMIGLMVLFSLIFFMVGCNGVDPTITGEKSVKVLIGTELPDFESVVEMIDIEADDVVIDHSSVDINTLGIYTVTYSINTNGEDVEVYNLQVEVVDYPLDNTPLLHGVADVTYKIGDPLPNLLLGVSADDREYGDISNLITVDQLNVNYQEDGVYEITYYVTNVDGYTQSAKALVTVIQDERYNLPDEFVIVENGGVGVIDLQGNVIIPMEYEEINYLGEGILQLYKNNSKETDMYKMSFDPSDIYYYNLFNQEYITYDYNLYGFFEEGIVRVFDEYEGLMGCMNPEGDLVLPIIYTEIYSFIDGKAIARIGDNYGLIGTDGTEYLGIQYNYVGMSFDTSYIRQEDTDLFIVSDGFGNFIQALSKKEYYPFFASDDSLYYKVEIYGETALIDSNYEIAMDPNYVSIYQVTSDVFAGTKSSGLVDLFNITNDELLEDVHEYRTSGNHIIVNFGDGEGLYNTEMNQMTIYPIYEELLMYGYSGDLYIVTDEHYLKGIITSENFITLEIENNSVIYDELNNRGQYTTTEGSLGLIGNDGYKLTSDTYSMISDFSEGYAYVQDTDTGLYGYINETGDEVIELEFLEAFNFVNGYAKVKVSELGMNFITTSGVLLSDVLYDDLEDFDVDGYAVVIDDGLETVMNSLGEELIPYSSNVILWNDIILYRGTDYYGAYLYDGTKLFEPYYRNIDYVGEGLYRLTDSRYNTYLYKADGTELELIGGIGSTHMFSDGLLVAGHDNLVFNTSGDLVFKVDDSDHLRDYSNNVFQHQDYDTRLWGFLDRQGKVVVTHQYAYMYEFQYGLAAVQDRNTGLWGYINNEGEYVIDSQYSMVYEFPEDVPFTVVVKSNHYTSQLIDQYGRTVVEDADSIVYYDGVYQVHTYKGSYEMFFDGEYLTYEVSDNEGNTYTMKYDNGWGLYSENTLVLESKYQSIEYLDYMDGWQVSFRGSVGFYNSDFEKVINEEYDSLIYLPYSDGFIKVYLNGNQGVFDMNGNQIVYPKYDYVSYNQYNDTFHARNGYIYGLFASDGTVLTEVEYLRVLYIDTAEVTPIFK